jgi:large subunit ribosomal protein L17
MRKFGRKTDQRRAFLKSLAANLVLKEKIKTTEARAKELRSLVERLITYGKKSDLAGKRRVAASLPLAAAQKLYKEIAPRFTERKGGYIRLTKIGRRMSDGAKMVFIEIVKEQLK